jgi:hypothetical protein
MTAEDILAYLSNLSMLSVAKPFILIILTLHILFTIVLVRQTKLMLEIIEARISTTIMAISIAHFLASLGVFLWVLILF